MNFKTFRQFSLLLVLMLTPTLSTSILGQSICPDPNKPCGSFKPYELSFRIPSSKALAKPEDRSAAFFAVILKSAKPCAISEDERLSVQTLFPRNKVFVSRFECEPEDNISYDTIDHGKHGVLAVYAGKTKREAATFLNQVRKTGRFTDAYVRRMAVVLVHP